MSVYGGECRRGCRLRVRGRRKTRDLLDRSDNHNSEYDLLNRLLELREAAKKCSNVDYRAALVGSADWLSSCLDRVHGDATTENMVSLNCAWVRSERMLKDVPPEAEPTPPQSVAEEMRMAA